MIEFKFSSNLEANLGNPYAALYYGISTMHCLTVSLAEGGAGLGTVWGEELARSMLEAAAFDHVDITDSPRPQNCIFICRPPCYVEEGPLPGSGCEDRSAGDGLAMRVPMWSQDRSISSSGARAARRRSPQEGRELGDRVARCRQRDLRPDREHRLVDRLAGERRDAQAPTSTCLSASAITPKMPRGSSSKVYGREIVVGGSIAAVSTSMPCSRVPLIRPTGRPPGR
jgi:hypothetical protein